MQLWLILIFISLGTNSFAGFLGKKLVHKIHPYQILFYQYIASIITVSAFVFFLKPKSSFSDVPLGFIVVGFMYAIGISSLYHAKKQSLSKTAIVGRFSKIIPIILAIPLLGEWKILSLSDPSGMKRIAGLVLTALSFYLFHQRKTHEGSEKTFDYNKWIRWITLNIIFIGVASFIVKYGVDSNEPLLILRLQYIGSFMVIASLCFFTKRSLNVGWNNISGAVLVGIFMATTLGLQYTALSLTSATQFFSVSSLLSIIIMTNIGAFFFKEKITWRLAVPFLLGLISIYLLK